METEAQSNAMKASAAWQLACWSRWPREGDWPGVMDVFEAAAFCRVNPKTIRRAVRTGRDGKAELAHQRFGSAYRFRKGDLIAYQAVKARAA